MRSVKIRFPVPDSDAVDAEWMWAKRVGDALFELENAPFHVYGISEGDVFVAEVVDSVLQFKALQEKRGNRTIRVRFPRGCTHADFEQVWDPLAALGCTFEGSQLDRPLYAISVPPSASVEAVVAYLSALEDAGTLEYEEADCGSPE